MKYTVFHDREKELTLLEAWYAEQKPRLIIIFGRRRVGKTELLKEFSKRHESIYLFARQESEIDQLKHLSSQIAEFQNDLSLQANPIRSWDALFVYLKENCIGVPIIFDEFPYLVQGTKALPSILQDYWDNYFARLNAFIILCGSSISMMESLLGYKSPLYGRRTGQIPVEPMSFFDAISFFQTLTSRQKVEFYAVLGGTPAYLLEFDENKSLMDNIKEKILSKNTFLAQDVLFVLREELDEPRNYYSILQSIAKGNTTVGRIMNDTGLAKSFIAKYLSVLIDLQLIERRIPITENHPEKSRKGIYMLKDNYFKFWFKYIFGNSQYIEQDQHDKLIQEKILPDIDSFVGKTFEDICLTWIKKTRKDYIVGRWWNKDNEIDIVGIDSTSNRALFGEVKWQDLDYTETKTIYTDLMNKSKIVEINCDQEEFVVLARSIQQKKEILDEGLQVYDLEDLLPSN